MRILVTQLTRMGDMLQTSPLIRSLKLRHPEAEITVMIRPMARAIAECNPDIAEIFVYDEDSMFANLTSHDSDRLLEAYENADTIVGWMKEKTFDVAYNCTHSVSSATLLKLAGIPQVIGAHLTDDWQFVLRGAWARYFFSSVFHRDYNDLNLCDITGRFAEDGEPCRELVLAVTDEDEIYVNQLLEEHGVAEDETLICMQLGASDDDKRWPASDFAATALMLSESASARIILLGVEEEAPLGQEFSRHSFGLDAVHLFGKTSIPQLSALLCRAQLLITNDTGTMHIAAASQCPVLLVSVGYVHFRETGPYGKGHIAVERAQPRSSAPAKKNKATSMGGRAYSRADVLPQTTAREYARPPQNQIQENQQPISPQQIHTVAQYQLRQSGGDEAQQLPNIPAMEGIDVYLSAMAPDGCLQWRPLIRRAMGEVDFLRMAYRFMWLEILGALETPDAEEKSIAALLASYDNRNDPGIVRWAAHHSEIFKGLAALAQEGVGITERLQEALTKKRDLAHAETLAGQLHRLDEKIRIYGETHPTTRPLVAVTGFERESLESADPIVLAETTLQIYQDCSQRAATMVQKIQAIAQAQQKNSGNQTG